MKLHVFEDAKADNFLPLTYMRGVFDLRVGFKTFRERFVSELESASINLFVRDFLKDFYAWKVEQESKIRATVNDESVDEENIFINGRLLLNESTLQVINRLVAEKNIIAFSGEDAAFVKADRANAEKVVELLKGGKDLREIKNFFEKSVDLAGSVTLIEWPWEIVKVNSEQLIEDYDKLFKGGAWEADYVAPNVTVLGGKERVYVSKGVEIEPFVCLDARRGPIYIGENTRIQAGARIEGPAYIGKDTIIIGGAQIREGSNIGDVCRVGGELEESVIHGYSNKYHFGFIGHAYIGEWINLGAGTTNSDLKDTYGNVRVNIRGRMIDTGTKKVGSFIGDMVKTSIGVCIYTGKLIGVAAHLHGIVWDNVPSFTIYAKSLSAGVVELYLDSALEIQRRMMGRRGKTLSQAEEELIRKVFEMTAKEREEFGVRKGKFILK